MSLKSKEALIQKTIAQLDISAKIGDTISPEIKEAKVLIESIRP
jgi:hypothetical protein